MGKTKKGQSPLLLRVMARFGEVEFVEGWLDRGQSGRHTLGLWQSDGTVTINPIPEMVDTIIHEIIHDLFPDYSERAVCSLTGKLRRQLSDEQMQTLYEEYKRRVTLSDRLQEVEDTKLV